MPQHVLGDNFGPVRQVTLGTPTASSGQPHPPIVSSINAATQRDASRLAGAGLKWRQPGLPPRLISLPSASR
jgi:hypothetical protein